MKKLLLILTIILCVGLLGLYAWGIYKLFGIWGLILI